MILALLAAGTLAGPVAAPALEAVQRCDAEAMQTITRAEPRRRSDWAAAFYAERLAIETERAAIHARAASPLAPEDVAALARLDQRQRALEGARAIESDWRALLDELRGDFLANCGRKAR